MLTTVRRTDDYDYVVVQTVRYMYEEFTDLNCACSNCVEDVGKHAHKLNSQSRNTKRNYRQAYTSIHIV